MTFLIKKSIACIFDILLILILLMKYPILKKDKEKTFFIIVIIFTCICITNFLFDKTKHTIFFMFCFIIYYNFIYKKLFDNNVLSTIFLLLILKMPFELFIEYIVEFILNSKLPNPINFIFLLRYIFIELIIKYIEYFIIIFILQKNTDIRAKINFKHYIIILSLFFSSIILLTTDKLFVFSNVGRTFVFIVIIYNIALIMFDRYQVKHEKITQEMMLTNQRIESEKEYLMTQIKNNEEIRKMRHDLKNHFLILNGYMKDGEYDDAKNYLHKHLDQLEDISKSVHCGNSCVDSVIESKRMVMIENGIEYKEHIAGLYIGDIDETDLALIIALALDNAIEASLKLESGRKIEMFSHSQKNTLILHIQNRICKGEKIDFHKTSKIIDPHNHGLGIKGMKEIVRRYDGSVHFEVNDEYVDVRLCFTLFYKKDK